MQSERSIQDYIDIARQGIARKSGAGKTKKVIIVGAGLAGLAAGYELKRAGHTPVILEAQQRVGGRVYTLREPFTEGLYAEVGAMRIPRAHTLTMAYIEKFGLRTDNFTMDNPNAYYYIGGKRMRASEAQADPSLMGFEVNENEIGKTAGRMYAEEIVPALIRCQHAITQTRKEIDLPAPAIPKLRKAVQENKQAAVVRPGERDVQPHAIGVEILMFESGDHVADCWLAAGNSSGRTTG